MDVLCGSVLDADDWTFTDTIVVTALKSASLYINLLPRISIILCWAA